MHYLIGLLVFVAIGALLMLLTPLLVASGKKTNLLVRVSTLPWWVAFFLIALGIGLYEQRKQAVGAKKPALENELLTAAFYWSGFTFQVQ